VRDCCRRTLPRRLPYRAGVSVVRVLYVEDHPRSANEVRSYLSEQGVEVHVVRRAPTALDELRTLRPDVVLLDIGPPGGAGLDLCRGIRQLSAVPIISASSFARDAVAGLEAGADDFVPKPYALRELLARIRALARRARGGAGPSRIAIVFGPLFLNPLSLLVKVDDSQITLTPSEFECLHALARNHGVPVSRESLLAAIHGSEEGVLVRSVDVLVSRLRQKLGDDHRRPRWIRTVRGVGYILRIPNADVTTPLDR